jgi:hypothetical protein
MRRARALAVANVRAWALVSNLFRFPLVRGLRGLEEARLAEFRTQDDLAMMDRLDLGSTDDKVAGSLDVDDEVIALDPADRADFLAAFLEEHVVADTDFKVVFHVGLPPCAKSTAPAPDANLGAAIRAYVFLVQVRATESVRRRTIRPRTIRHAAALAPADRG